MKQSWPPYPHRAAGVPVILNKAKQTPVPLSKQSISGFKQRETNKLSLSLSLSCDLHYSFSCCGIDSFPRVIPPLLIYLFLFYSFHSDLFPPQK